MSILHHSSEQSEPVAISPSHGAADHNPITNQMAVFYTDLQGEFGACNSAFSQLFGYSPQELIGREFWPYLPRPTNFPAEAAISCAEPSSPLRQPTGNIAATLSRSLKLAVVSQFSSRPRCFAIPRPSRWRLSR